tara:strand:+ start:712 stop:1485 length:774 start_codon:yes stop_codon:yes gene_type:complete
MRFLILIFVFFLACEDDPVSPETDCDGEYDECDVCNGTGDWDGYDCGDLDFMIDLCGILFENESDEFCILDNLFTNMGFPSAWFDTHNGRLTSITLPNPMPTNWVNITALPESVGNLSNLLSLNISNQSLTSLPNSIGNLSSLEELILFENNLISIPESIGNLSELQYLNLQGNQLTSLPESIGDLSSLEFISLYNNQLTNLPSSICNLPNDCTYVFYLNNLCEEYNYDCIEYLGGQDQSNCCEGPEGQPNWTTCTE